MSTNAAMLVRNSSKAARRLLQHPTTTRRMMMMTTKSSPQRSVQTTNLSVTKFQSLDKERKFFSMAVAEANFEEVRDFPTRSSTTTTSTSQQQFPQDKEINLIQKVDIDFDALQKLASQTSTPLRLKQMYKYASLGDSDQRLLNAQFLYKELQIRIAQIALHLLTLPYGLSSSRPIRAIANIYLNYLSRFPEVPCPQNHDEEDAFTDMLQSLVLDRSSVPDAVAQGVASWKEENRNELDIHRLQEMEDALYRFFTARVGLRLLTEHHILSSSKRNGTSERRHLLATSEASVPEFLGVIQNNCDPINCVEKIAREVTRLTEETFGLCPEIQVVSRSSSDAEFTYVPHHLQYMLTELLKNSCRATILRYINTPSLDSERPAPVHVVVVKGVEDVTIKVADRGGGVPRSTMQQIFTFAHSTADDLEEQKTDFGKNAFTGGSCTRGFGLPMTRIYARYLGGELTLKSMEGYGLDAYLYLPRLGDACENLPARVKLSPGERDSTPVSSNSSQQHQSRKFTTKE